MNAPISGSVTFEKRKKYYSIKWLNKNGEQEMLLTFKEIIKAYNKKTAYAEIHNIYKQIIDLELGEIDKESE